MKLFLCCLTLSSGFLLATPLKAGEIEVASNSSEESTQTQAIDNLNQKLIDEGLVAYNRNNVARAIKRWQTAIANLSRQGESKNNAIAEVRAYLALAYQEAGKVERAKETIAQAKEVAIAPAQLRGKIWNISGSLNLNNGNYDAAIADWDIADRAYSEKRDLVGQIGSKIDRAIAMQKIGQYRQSLHLLEQQREDIAKIEDATFKLKMLHNLGIAQAKIGDYPEAEASLKEALTLGNSDELKANVALDLGNLYVRQDIGAAEDFYDRAIELSNEPTTKVVARLNKLTLLDEATNTKSIKTIQREIQSLRPSNHKNQLYLRAIEYQHSIAPAAIGGNTIAKLTEIANNDSIIRNRSYAYGLLSKIHSQKPEEAIVLAKKALELARQQGAYDLSYRWQWQLGQMLRDSDYDTALNYYKNAVDNLNRVRGDLIAFNPDTQFSFKSSIEPVYREFVALVLQEPTQENLKLARNTIESLQMAELENYFRSACLRAEPQQIDSIDRTTATIYPIVLDEELAVITAIGDKLVYQSHPITEGEVAQTVNNFVVEFNPARSRRRREQFGAKIYQWLVAENQELFQANNIDTLAFVLDNELRNLPVAAINTGDGYLVEEYRLALTPGLQLLPSSPISEDRLEAVVGGLSEARQGFSALPGVATEVEEITNNIDSNLLLNREFTTSSLQTALAETKDAPILHLATHGQFSSDPEETFVLTWDDRLNVDRMEELLKVREETPKLVPVELLLLSACKTALGDAEAGLGLAGVAVRSGARSTLATLWSVSDDSTVMLVDEIYNQLQQSVTKGEVLRQAQLKLIESEQFSHPYYWSPFVLVGNWN